MPIASPPVVPNPASATFGADCLAYTLWMATAAPQIDAAAQAADSSAQTAVAAAIGTQAASCTTGASLTNDTVAKTFTVEAGKAITVGANMTFSSNANSANKFSGTVSAYNISTGSLSVTVTGTAGSTVTVAGWSGVVTKVATPPTLAAKTITSAYTLVSADAGSLIRLNGTFTLAAAAAATLGNGWWCFVQNVGAGTVTFDPNAAELVDGIASGAIAGAYLLQCDGVGFTTMRVGPEANRVVLASGTSWTALLGARNVKMRMVGGSGCGFGSNGGTLYYGSGAAGGYLEVSLALQPGTVYAYEIGAGGTNNGAGGNTSFAANGNTYIANGGAAGSTAGPASGGSASGSGALCLAGADGGFAPQTIGSPPGGQTLLGTKGGRATLTTSGTAGSAGLIILEW